MIVIDRIKKKFNQPLHECKQEKGPDKVCLDGFQDFTIFKGEKFFPEKPLDQRCDCIIIASSKDKVYVIIVELRSGTIRANDVQKKIKNCEQVAKNKFSSYLPKECQYLYCLVSKTGPKAIDMKDLERHTISRINYKQKLISILPKG